MYIDGQVTDHARTLALVDAAIGRAQNAELRSALQTQVRPHVAEHLQVARQLQQRLGSR
jgi:predicted outer membrane protein